MREGLWQEESRTHRRGDVSLRVPLRFARVQIAPEASSMIVRVKLSNGRCAEIEIGAIEQLGEVLGVLERAP